MKILRIIARLNIGGPGRHCLWLFELDKQYEYSTKLLYGFVEPNEEELPVPNEYKDKCIQISGFQRSIKFKDFFTFFNILIEVFKIKPDIIHTHTSKAGFHGRLAACIYNLTRIIFLKKPVPVIHTFHGHTFCGYFSKPKELVFKAIEKILARLCTKKIVAISRKQLEEISEVHNIASIQKFSLLPLGIDTERFAADNINKEHGGLRAELGLDSKIKLVAFISRIAPIKNHFFYIDVCKKYIETYDTNIRFLIVGDGEKEFVDKLKNYTKTLKVDEFVLFTGTRLDLEKIYADIDLVALTSNNEGTPVSLIEAMSAKKPCVATNVGGVSDLLSQNRGVLVKVGDLGKFAASINEILNNPDGKNCIVNNAYAYVKDMHSKQSLLKRVDQLYKNI